TLDAAALGLPSSLFYSLRVLPVKDGHIVGQASPSSGVSFDDGLAPGGQTINDFDIVPDSPSTVSTSAYDFGGNPLDSAIFPYAPATGSYRAPFGEDRTGQSVYYVLGSDPSLQQTAALEIPWYDTHQYVQTYDSVNGHRVKNVRIDLDRDFLLLG